MKPDPVPVERPLPPLIGFLAGSAVALHLLAFVALVLSAPSGPWPTNFGQSPALGPPFASNVGEKLTRAYLTPLKMTHNYHFTSNRPGQPSAYFVVQLKDEHGQTTRTLRFPDPKANFWVRQRQAQLAQALTDDQPVQPASGEKIFAPNQQVRKIEIWDMDREAQTQTLKLRAIEEHLVPRDRPVFRPSEWSMVVAQASMRHLCREHGAASARLLRHSREALMPALLFMPDLPRESMNDLVTDFGEVKK